MENKPAALPLLSVDTVCVCVCEDRHPRLTCRDQEGQQQQQEGSARPAREELEVLERMKEKISYNLFSPRLHTACRLSGWSDKRAHGLADAAMNVFQTWATVADPLPCFCVIS